MTQAGIMIKTDNHDDNDEMEYLMVGNKPGPIPDKLLYNSEGNNNSENCWRSPTNDHNGRRLNIIN